MSRSIRIGWTAILGSALLMLAAMPLLASGCGGDETSADAAIPELIRATERERLRALVDGDLDVVRKLHADDFQLITPVGDTYSKEEYLAGIEFGGLNYILWEPVSPIRVRVYDDAAVIRYRSELELPGAGRQRYWHTDVYEKRDGGWQIVWSQATGAP
jgi:Domain of unknown function (DUF4440)